MLSIGGELGQYTGSAHLVYGAAAGGSAKLELPLSGAKPLYAAITSGYSLYLTRLTYNGSAGNLFFWNVAEGGLKYFFSKIGYVEGDAGLSVNLNRHYTGAKNALVYSPVVGFTAPTSKHKAFIDISARYEGRTGSGIGVSQLAVRLAYRFGI